MSEASGKPGDGRLLEHAYDGIQEYDNPLPGWWKWVFVLCIIHSIGYVVYYHFGGGGKSELEEYAEAYEAYSSARAATAKAEAGAVSEEALAALQADATAMAAGREVFLTNCQSCHTDDGRGLVGPNLTDEFQVHGASRMDIYTTIRDGVPAKGMMAWGPVLKPNEIDSVTAYVASLRGTNRPNGKPPEGEKVGAFTP